MADAGKRASLFKVTTALPALCKLPSSPKLSLAQADAVQRHHQGSYP